MNSVISVIGCVSWVGGNNMKYKSNKKSGTSDILRICLTAFIISIVISSMFLWTSPGVTAKDEKKVKVKGNTLPAIKDPSVENKGKPKADQKLFLVISLNIEPMPSVESTIFIPQSTISIPQSISSGQQKYDSVISFLKDSGLKVLQEFPDLSAIWAEGTVKQVEITFQVSINKYKLKDKEFFANDRDPSVPEGIADAIIAVAGLEDYVAFEPSLGVNPITPQANVTPSAETVGPPYDPYEIRSAYGFNSLYTSGSPNTLKGKGVYIAIIDAYGNTKMATDWAAFCFGTQNWGAGPWQGGALPTTPTIVTFYPTGAPIFTDEIWALETALDVEWAHSIAPEATINLVIAKNDSFTHLLAAYQWTITNSKGAAISMSFGARESDLTEAYKIAWYAASRTAAKKGITLVASSGDAGYDSGNILHPSSDPYTLAVGGTSLTMAGAYPGTWSGESAWSYSGGGKSILYPKPPWQYGKNVPIDGVRDTPDVSMVADPSTGVYVYCSTYSPHNNWWQVGGTSLSAPMWAAFIAIIDQSIGAVGAVGGIGYAEPWLYRVFRSADYTSTIRDITTGGQIGGYAAGLGYDMVTGTGSLKSGYSLLIIGAKYLRLAQNITYIPGAKAIAVTSAGKIYIGTFQRPPGVSWPYTGVLYELEKGSTTPRAVFKAAGGITDIAVDTRGAYTS